MAELYLIPCTCGQKVRVGKAQAGQAVDCACGKRVPVPTLRGLRDLELAPPEAATTAARIAAWSPWHGAAFSGGLAIAAVALFVFAMNLWYFLGSSSLSEDRSGDVIQAATGELDDFSALQLLAEWDSVVKDGLGHVHTPDWVIMQESAKIYRWRTIASASVALLASLVAIGAVFLGRRR